MRLWFSFRSSKKNQNTSLNTSPTLDKYLIVFYMGSALFVNIST